MTKEDYLNSFYHKGLKEKLEQNHDKDKARLIMTIDNVDIKIGRYGVYAQQNEDRVTIDDSIIPSEVSVEDIAQMIKAKNAEPTEFGQDDSGEKILLKNGRFGPYVQCGKKMKSLPPGVTDANLTEDIAKEIVSMPREIGVDANTKKPIVKDIGRYGPYIRCGSATRKVDGADNILDLTEERAIELLSTKQSNTQVLKELGEHDKLNISVKNGRYGIYVTNGKVNVTLPKDINYENLDLDTAVDMISKKKKKKKFFKRK
jgi:DNA topoisomerase-1